MATETLYILEIKMPDQDSRRIPIQGRITVGSSEEVDISISEYGLAPRHCVFKESNEILTVQNTGGEGAVVVGKQKLAHGKMYIIDKGDSVKMGELTFVVRTEEAEAHYVDDDGSTIAGPMDADDLAGDDEHSEETKSFISKITGLFKGKDKDEEEDDEEEDDDHEVQVIDHTGDENDSPTPASRLVKATGGIGAIKPKKVRVSPFIKQRRAGVIIRLMGFILNLAIVYSVFLYALPLLGFEEHFQKYYELFMKLMEKATPVTTQIPPKVLMYLTNFTTFKILVIFISLEVVSSLLLGTSIGLFLLGVTGNGGFIGKRIKALIRTIFSFITSPLLITELPVLLKFRTLKEVLSHSQLEKRSNVLSLLLGVTIAPLGILAAFLWPLVNDPLLLKMPEYEVTAKAPKKKGKRESNYIGASSYLGLKIDFYKKPSLEFIPSLEKQGIKLHIFNLKNAKQASLSKGKVIDLNDQFKVMFEQNPFFQSFSPALHAFMGEEKDSKNIVGEISALTRDAMGITYERLHEVLLEHGPYINGLMDIRLKLISSLGITNKFKTVYFEAARKEYLLIQEESPDLNQSMIILPLGSMEIEPFLIKFKSKDKVVANNFFENFFKKAGKMPKGFEFDPNQVDSWNDLSVLDYFSTKKKIDEEVTDKIVNFYDGKIAVLKAPAGMSAKAKKLYAKQLKRTFERSAAQLEETSLAKKLAKLVDELPGEAKPKKESK